jgi:rare lipoprotein A
MLMKTYRFFIPTFAMVLGTTLALHAQSYASYTAEIEIGMATFYGDHLQGQATASGEAYRADAFTAAHSSYPIGTVLRITRLDNNQTVEVRVNDRLSAGKETVVVNVSRAAAAQLGLLAAGRAQVRVERILSSGGPTASLTARSPYASSQPAATNTPASYNQETRVENPQSTWENQLFRDEKYAPGRRQATQTQQRGQGTGTAGSQQSPSSFSWNDNLSTRGGNATPVASASSSRLLPAGSSGFAIQVASYGALDNAASHANRLAQQGFNGAYVWQKDGRNRVVLASFPSRAEAMDYLTRLRQQHNMDGIVVSL